MILDKTPTMTKRRKPIDVQHLCFIQNPCFTIGTARSATNAARLINWHAWHDDFVELRRGITAQDIKIGNHRCRSFYYMDVRDYEALVIDDEVY